MNTQDFKRKLTAVFSADVAGYSRLMGEDESATVMTLEVYKQVMFSLIKQHRGRVIDSPGDNLLAEFASVVDAVQCGVAVQKELQARNAELPENRKMQFRLGINLGDVIEEQDRIYGDGVNIAARLEALAEPGGICISKTAFDYIENKLPLGYQFIGHQTVKNIAKPVGAYKVLMEPRVIDVEQKEEVETVRPDKPPAPLPDKPSIAVLPFTNLSGDPELDYFSDGISEEIITGLSKIPKMLVIARNSTFIYKGKPVKAQVVSEELGVRYILEGSVRKAGKRVRITAQLVDATTGHHLWADRYDRDLDDIFALQDEITMKILTALQVELTEGQQARVSGKGTANFEAYMKFMQSRRVFTLSGISKEAVALSRQITEEAIKLDQGYAAPYVHLAWSHWFDARFGLSDSRAESFKQAYLIAQKAETLDDSIPDVHALLAGIYLYKGEHEKAIARGERAISLGPNNAEVHALMAHILRFSGKFDQAIAMIKKALRLQPYYPTWYLTELAMCYYYVGRNEEAIEVAENYRKLTQKRGEDEFLWPYYLMLTLNYVRLGKEREAREALGGLLKLFPGFTFEWDRQYSVYKDPEHLERQHEDLRKAGLK